MIVVVLFILANPTHTSADGWAKVIRIVDGDTIIVEREFQQERVRLFGVSAPEPNERCGPEASGALDYLLFEAGDGFVLMEDGPRLHDVYGRTLAYLWVWSTAVHDTVLVDWVMVRAGYGIAWMRDGQHRDYIAEAESEARRTGAGCLWK